MTGVSKSSKLWMLYLLPFVLGVTLFKLWPFLRVLVISFQEGYNYLTGSYNQIGFGNYLNILQDHNFRQAIVNTAVYVFVDVTAVICISLPIAWCMLRVRFGLPFFQTAIFLPFATSDIAIGMAWKLMFSNNGILNHLLGILSIDAVGWLTDANMSLVTFILYGIWNGIPMTVLIFYCGLLNIDPSILIAARASGAGEMKIFRKIVLPMMRSSITMVFSINSVFAWLAMSGLFPLFMGQPGPYNNMYTLMYYIYNKAQQGKFGFASACAASCVLLVLVGVFQCIRFLFKLKRRNKRG